ncbi:type II toxin-antitoxin system MazE family antitoxin [Crocosphaera sp.]|uniref:type II toxin-antitoxin system MazE family antitoxin n=1 Tax=Crocosphaera sp. TaxID=2729996 RepID=UPI003F288A74|nr:CopG family transcriptional regulator [Crocosphaera sp.]
MKKQKIAITLDESLIGFLDKMAKGNRSQYLNHLLTQHRNKVTEEQLIASLSEDSQDPQYQQEIQEWDGVVGDGINEEE